MAHFYKFLDEENITGLLRTTTYLVNIAATLCLNMYCGSYSKVAVFVIERYLLSCILKFTSSGPMTVKNLMKSLEAIYVSQKKLKEFEIHERLKKYILSPFCQLLVLTTVIPEQRGKGGVYCRSRPRYIMTSKTDGCKIK